MTYSGYIVELKNGSLTRLQKSIPLKILLTNTKVGRNTKALVAGVGERAIRHPKPMTSVFEAIDAICKTTLKYQLRSKLTGAGGGGCVLTIIPDRIL